jgi:hypothetical protein
MAAQRAALKNRQGCANKTGEIHGETMFESAQKFCTPAYTTDEEIDRRSRSKGIAYVGCRTDPV